MITPEIKKEMTVKYGTRTIEAIESSADPIWLYALIRGLEIAEHDAIFSTEIKDDYAEWCGGFKIEESTDEQLQKYIDTGINTKFTGMTISRLRKLK